MPALSRNNIFKHLDDNKTFVNSKYGDSNNKLAKQISSFVKSLELEETPANLNSATILVKNNIDINKKNISEINKMVKELEYLNNKLYPEIIVAIVQDKYDIQNMKTKDLQSYVKKYIKENGEPVNFDLHNYLSQVDTSNEKRKLKKEILIAVYKSFKIIAKDNYVCTGIVYKHNVKRSILNYVEAYDNYAKTKGIRSEFDIVINDLEQKIKQIKPTANSIFTVLSKSVNAQIEAAKELFPDVQKTINKKSKQIKSTIENAGEKVASKYDTEFDLDFNFPINLKKKNKYNENKRHKHPAGNGGLNRNF